MDLQQKLKERGWYLTEEGVKKLPDGVDKSDVKNVIQAAMDMDFREIASGALPTEINKKDESIPGKVALQIAKIRNISAPKANEDSKQAPRFLQIEFTDGVNHVTGLELEHISSLSMNTPPGTKIFLRQEKVSLMQGMIMLRSSDIDVIGGRVASLVEKWEFSRTLQKYAKGGRMMSGSSGPPPWIPFGQKIQQNFSPDKNFKSLGNNEKEKEGKENNEFETMRSEAIAEAAKAGGKKVFGGGNQQMVDYNVKKIIEKGYTEEEAKNALKTTKNNLERALYNLKRRDEFKNKDSDFRDKGRNSLSKRGSKDPKKTRDDLMPTSKPVGNVSLFDFLTDKLPMADTSEKSNPRAERGSSQKPSESSKPYYNSQQQSQPHHSQQQSNQYQSGQQQQYHQQPQSTNIPNSNQSNRPKFENNISSSFANRGGSLSSTVSESGDKGRPRGGGGGQRPMGNDRNPGGSNSYSTSNRYQDDSSYGDRYRDGQKPSGVNNYNRNQKQDYRGGSSNYNHNTGSSSHLSSTGNVSGGYESRNRNDNQQRNGYDKNPGKMSSGPSRYPTKPESNSSYQSNNRNYNDNRQSSYNSETNKMSKIIEDTSKMKLDNKGRYSTYTPRAHPNSAPMSQQQHQQHQQSQQQQQQQQQQHQHQQQQQYQTQHQQAMAMHHNQVSSISSHQQQQQVSHPHGQPPTQQQQHTIAHNAYAQLPNGFPYDSSKIMGFQSKETNEFAMTILKNQGALGTGMPQPPPTPTGVAAPPPHHAQFAPPSIQIPQHPNFPPTPFVMPQPVPAQVAAAAFSMRPGDTWNWKVGDRCLAKYWDDSRYYEAEITGVSDTTCVVYYLGYGNHEEVVKSDCLPITDAQHRPINFAKLHETHPQSMTALSGTIPQQHQSHQPPSHQQPPIMTQAMVNRGMSNRYRGERQMYVPPPKREA